MDKGTGQCPILRMSDYDLEGYIPGYIRRDGKLVENNIIDATVAAGGSCEACGKVGLECVAYSREDRSSYRAFAVCPLCGHVEEF